MDWFHQFRTDENQALKDIYRLYLKDCLSWLRRKYNLQEVDAMDVFQQSILILYNNTATGKLTELSGDIKSYLYGIARNKAMEAGRSTSRTIYPENLDSDLTEIPDTEPEEETNLVALVKTLLPELGEACRQLLEMYYYKDLNMNEIAEMTHYNGADSVKTQKYKCIKRLQMMLLEHIGSKR